MSAFHDNALIGASGSQGYQISRSVRLRSSASAYFNRTPGSAGNRRTWTWSGWVKRGDLSASSVPLLSAYSNASNFDLFRFGSNSLQFYTIAGGVDYSEETPAVFRDPSAWYHIVLSVDTTQATAANRFRLYVNGVQQTTTQTFGQVPQNYDCYVNSTNAHNLGRNLDTTAQVFDGYLTEINFIDGQALTPSSFGETNPTTGVWQPKKYTGTYGTNGFYLNFSDNSAATAAAIGKDYSGNGNNWTPNNISVTSGATYDSMLDVPTPYADGGNGRGNYCVLNPLAKDADVTLSNGNLGFSCTSAGLGGAIGTIAVTSGKWYWEVTVTGGTASAVGIAKLPLSAYDANQTGTYLYLPSGDKRLSPSTDSAYGASYTTNDVIGVALDMDAGTVAFYKNNSSQGTAFSSLSGDFTAWMQDGTSGSASSFVANFGQRPFAYTPPSGFRALNTQNLPEPTIKKGNAYFDATTYTGNGGTQGIVNSGAMQPDLVWVKRRNAAGSDHYLADAVRGAGKQLISNSTAAEATNNGITSFDASGFSVGAVGDTNANTGTFVGWQWKEGATQGFDIQAITAQASGSANFSHSLGVAPAMYIVKPRANAGGWNVYHQSLGATKVLALNGTGAAVTSSTTWNNTAPTSSVFTLGTDYAAFGTQIVYLFAEVAGFSKFGSYTGNGSADGPMIFTGFRPAFILIKQSSASGQSWQIQDSTREPYNDGNRTVLFPDLSNAEITDANPLDFLSNGFKIRNSGNGNNASGATYIYAAFAANPFKNSLAF